MIVTTCEMVAVVHLWPCLQHLTCCSINSRHIGSESRFLPTPPTFDATVRGFRQNIAIPFGTEKLEWCGCPTVKKFRRYLYSFWHNSRTWQTETDRQTPHDGIGRAYVLHRIARQKSRFSTNISLYLGTDARQSHGYYGRRIGNRTQAFEWYQFEWSWVTSNADFEVTIFFNVK